MTYEQIEMAAVEGRRLDGSPPLSALSCHALVEALLAGYKRGGLTREEVAARKRQIRTAFARAQEEENRRRAAWGQYQEDIRRAGALLGEIGRESDPARRALLQAACIGRMCGEDAQTRTAERALAAFEQRACGNCGRRRGGSPLLCGRNGDWVLPEDCCPGWEAGNDDQFPGNSKRKQLNHA